MARTMVPVFKRKSRTITDQFTIVKLKSIAITNLIRKSFSVLPQNERENDF